MENFPRYHPGSRHYFLPIDILYAKDGKNIVEFSKSWPSIIITWKVWEYRIQKDVNLISPIYSSALSVTGFISKYHRPK